MTTITRRRVLAGLALAAAMLVVGFGAYLAASWTAASPPSAASTGHEAGHATGHGGHVMPDGQTMPAGDAMPSAHTMPSEHTMPSATPSDDMGGMDMSGMDMGDHPSADDGANAAHGAHGAHGGDSDPSPSRPRSAVLGAFGALNGGVLITAAVLRRRGHGSRRTSQPGSQRI